MKGTTATLFVDDYVNGRVPNVCAISGEPTTDRLIMSSEIDGPSPGWLFLLLFPILGWVILVLVYAFSRRSHLQGQLPISEESYSARRNHRRYWYAALAVGVVVLLFGTRLGSVAQLSGAMFVLGIVALLVGAIGLIRAATSWPAVTLDGSRRWVTVHRVHPAFAEAVAMRIRKAELPL